MNRITTLNPRNSTFAGNKIGLEGEDIWLRFEKAKTNFRQNIIRVDRVGTNASDRPLEFYADRDITGTLSVSGVYEAMDSHYRNALGRMCKIDPVDQVTIALDTGITYRGNLIVLSDQNEWSVNGDRVNYNTTFHFSGEIVGDGGNESAFDGENGSGEDYTNLKSVTGAASMSYTRSYIDQSEDRAIEPFIVVGISEASGVPLSVAEQNVVASLGGADHTWQNISEANGGIPFSRITSRWAGMNIIVGELIYDRNALDCKRYQYQATVGFIVKGSEGEVITGDSGSDEDNVCADLASGPFAIRFAHWRNSTVPYTIHLVPCVSATNPRTDSSAVGMIGAINSNAIFIDGVSCPATELRFDGFQNLKKYSNPSGSKYFFYMKFSQLDGGWTDGTLQCARLVPLPLEGNQSTPSYTVEASVVQLYDYRRTAFDTIAQICPLCYD